MTPSGTLNKGTKLGLRADIGSWEVLGLDPCHHQKQLERVELELDRNCELVELELSWNWEVRSWALVIVISRWR